MKNRKIKIIFLALGTLTLLLFLSYDYIQYQKNKNLEVSFIDVGQGDAIFIKTPQQRKIIIDFANKQGLKDLAKKIPWWDKTIDLIIISHPHDDHIVGLIPIIKKYKIKNIIYNGVLDNSPFYLELLKIIKEKNIPLLVPQENQTIELEPNCKIKFLFPGDRYYQRGLDNLNNSSIVNQLICQNSIFLFMGDAETEVENELLEQGINLKSDVIKIGHHGSLSSSQEKFLKAVQAKIAIIMVGKNNKYGHPSLRILKRLEKLQTEIFRTDLNGSITIIDDGKTLKPIFSF